MPPLSARPLEVAKADELPMTVSAMQALTDVQELGQDFEVLALIGTQFENALFSTRNNAALLTDTGGYGALQGCVRPFHLARSRVNLRFSRGAGLRLLSTKMDEAEGMPASLLAVDPWGTIHHRVQLTSPEDFLVFDSIGVDPLQTQMPVAEEPERPAKNVVSLPAILRACRNWDQMDAGQHMNGLMAFGGLDRFASLPHVGQSRAWQIKTGVLASFWEFLCDQSISFGRCVAAGGMLHSKIGIVDHFQLLGSLALCRS